jgi:heat shock protein HtpX
MLAAPVFGSYPNLFEQQQRNRRKTVLVVAVFILFLGFLGLGFDLYFFGTDPLGFLGPSYGFPVASLIALGVGGMDAFWGFSGGATAVLASARAYPVPDNDPRFRMLNNVVDEMTIASGIPRPAVYIIPDPDPNAFATGRDPEHSAIAVTEGLLETLNRDELQGVVAHEMGHIKNYDIRLTTIVAALVGAAFLLSDWGTRGMMFGFLGGGRGKSRSRSKSSGGMIGLVILVLWVITLILAPMISRLLVMSVSRQREYLADASGAELTRNPLGLASALTKIQNASAPTASIKKGSAHLCIADPLGKKINFREGRIAEIFGTHPPIEKRITLLRAMAYQYDAAGTTT